jgi:hypothetical protein
MTRAVRTAAGLALLAVGLVLLILPGPGIPLLAGGLLLLERDFPWAARARQELSAIVGRVGRALRRAD